MSVISGIRSAVYQDHSGDIGKRKREHRGLINTEQVRDFVTPEIGLLFKEQCSVFRIQYGPAVLHV